MTTDHDPGYKRLFSHPAMIHDLLRGFVAEPWIEELDESRHTDAALAIQRNLVAALFRLENSRHPAQVRTVLTALVDWLASPEQRPLRRSFLAWLKKGSAEN